MTFFGMIGREIIQNILEDIESLSIASFDRI